MYQLTNLTERPQPMAQIKMTNTFAVQDRESTFSMERIDKGYKLTFENEVINT